jgi:ABC-type multidrug transport system ATPase subunit
MNSPSPSRSTRHIMPSFPLKASGDTVFGSDTTSDQVLPRHQRIAKRHLIIHSDGKQTRLRDLGAGTNVNGRWVIGRSVDLLPGDEIDIGPLALRFTGARLESVASMSQVQLTASDVSHTVSHRGKPKHLLQDVSLVIKPGEFVCFLGPSGCGKSTLMSAVSGRSEPNGSKSVVHVNHRDLYKQFEQLKQNLVIVPQRTVVHGDLTAKEALNYTAMLRLPPTADREARIQQLVEQMELEEFLHTPVHQLSGGQNKRLCLANELMSDPGLIFLDEVTSGLDSLTDQKMMKLFRDLADGGKTVVCITHSLAYVLKTCHIVVVLAPGGRVVYIGPPAGALVYFKISDLNEIYSFFEKPKEEKDKNAQGHAEKFARSREDREKQQAEKIQRYAERFAGSPEYQEYVKDRMPQAVPEPPTRSGSALREIPTEALATVRQTTVLIRRSLTVLRRDRAMLGSLVGQALLVALILIAAFGTFGDFPAEDQIKNETIKEQIQAQPFYIHKPRMLYAQKLLNFLFLLGVTSFWFGCNNAAKEMVRERTITVQEHMFNLRPFAYFSSKLLILSVVSCLQAAVLISIVWGCCGPPGKLADFLPIILGLAFVGTTLGLAISALAPSENVAVAMIPIAVIPQIILSGAIVSLTGMALAAAELFVTTYWGKQGLDAFVHGEAGDFARKETIKLIESSSAWPAAIALSIHACVFCLFAIAGVAADGSFPGALKKLTGRLTRSLPYTLTRR